MNADDEDMEVEYVYLVRQKEMQRLRGQTGESIPTTSTASAWESSNTGSPGDDSGALE